MGARLKQHLETWLGEPLTQVLIDKWEKEGLDSDAARQKSASLLEQITGRSFEPY